ncbi:Phage terminase-like protein, large subunit (plasmid) [Piscirickettsia salmonis]|uniref:terminase large subunit n=1 Tax=Piscirickettsia salmonis TaxID=1238 RepID=UPI0012BAB2CE|nr:terminase TerL endonuclease subunit [Piscirickettsia salmonis]QGO68339.1 Phage terminase-like protein, large subunit [Piscirickettsia salmonis]
MIKSDPVKTALTYCDNVLSGRVIACDYVKKACQRHLNDLKYAGDPGFYFDKEAACKVVRFFSYCKHSKGEWYGKKITLEPWQLFIITTVFGWRREVDGMRRFRTVYEEVARKNGKSTKLSGTGLYLFCADEEPGAEVYAAATKRDQAKIVFDDAVKMVRASKALASRIGIYKNNMHYPKDLPNNKFEPLSSDSQTQDGLNVHSSIVDELHAHKTGDLWRVLETGTGSRRQPLLYAITTAGFDQTGICYSLRDYAVKVLENIIEDDTFFGIIYTLDKEDDWTDERVWIKANPNLGISKKLDDMQRQCVKAQQMKGERNGFLCKHLNIWTNAETAWLDLERWKTCAEYTFKRESLENRPCYIGLDLASTNDIAALVAAFLMPDDSVRLFCRFYLPKETVMTRAKQSPVPYQLWSDEGYLTLTEGNVIDYNYIKDDIYQLNKEFDVKEITYDPWNATQLANDLLEEGANMVEFRQDFKSMTPALKELERLVISTKLHHNNNPVLNWMASNLVVVEDDAGNMKPSKRKSTEKIDGMVAIAMAVGRLIAGEDHNSIYNERELLIL